MNEVRILTTGDFHALVSIFADAYPGLKIVSHSERDRLRQQLLKLHEEEATAHFHGLFRDRQLLGTMCLYDFSMNFLQIRIPVGGVGQVAVAFPHKKEHVGREMMDYFLHHFQRRDTPLVALYPFRPDFYRKMGFGYGTKMSQYRVKPTALPKGPSKAHVRYLDTKDRQSLLECYNRVLDRTHGMMEKSERELDRLFANPQNRIVGYEQGGQILGYLVFTFEAGETWLLNDVQITEFIYEDPNALAELLTFLHTQADQIRHVILNTQDEYLHYLLLDPRNGSNRLIPAVYHETNTQGVGLMYRVIDTRGMLERLGDHDFGGQTCKLKLTIVDSFLPENAGSILLRVDDGRLQCVDAGTYDVEVCLDIAEFSSLLAGTVSFRSLVKYGLAGISDPAYVTLVDRAFAVQEKPMCTTPF